MSNEKQFMTLPFEVKEVAEGSGIDGLVTITGYAAAFNNIDSYNDVIEKGAFTKWIASGKTSVPILLDHNSSIVTTAGYNTSAVQDDTGLLVVGELNTKTDAGRTAFENIKHAFKLGKQIGLSIGYFAVKREYDQNEVRRLIEVDVVEYSITNFPANENASITSLKSILETGDTEKIAERKRFIEKTLREKCGCSKKEAQSAVSVIFTNIIEEEKEKQVIEEKRLADELAIEQQKNQLETFLNNLKKS